jgi:hypothetical protein
MPEINPALMPHAIANYYAQRGKVVFKCVVANRQDGSESYTVTTKDAKTTWQYEGEPGKRSWKPHPRS